jgi:hypothetical protein
MADLTMNRNDKLILDNDQGANSYIRQNASDEIQFYYNGTLGFCINSGYVGVNTGTPAGIMEIQSANPGTGTILVLTNK